ncbi:hypothetical protein H7X69_02895 [Candidatus Saccharibacteria bacterium]|nr:hypothetical protein [Candidatus Saccharibacteria bacterium]
MKHYIIYVPGLGDDYDDARRLALKGWRIWGVKTELVPMCWYDGKPYDEKQRRVIESVKRAQNKGYAVSLIGESAGGSLAINVAAQVSMLHRLITIGGVNNPAIQVSPHTLQKAPAFDESIRRLVDSLPKIATSRTHVVRALYDPIVHAKYTYISGAHNHRIYSIGHLTTIVLCLSIFSSYIVSLIKRTPNV